MGNGIWFEPYKISKDQKAVCIHALWENGKIGMLPSCVRGDYNYFERNWYAEIIQDLKAGKKISWTRPYKSSEVEFLMTTVGVGLYDQKELVGIAMVDWQMDTILKSILKIKPTPNSFVLFADKTNDYIIATTEQGINNNSIFGKPLKTLKWYSKNLQEGYVFDYKGTSYIPYIKQLNNGLFLIVNVPLFELFGAAVHHLAVLLSILLISTIIIVGILYLVLRRNINDPIQQLSQIAQKISRGDLNKTIQLDKPSELAQLAEVFNKMKSDIKTHLMQLAKVSSEKEKIESELAIAKTIQASALPTDFPQNASFELVASMTPAREVGGDFYDFFPVDENHFAFLMADVSGKGITAALYMMSAKTAIKNMLQAGYPLSEAITKANKTLCDNHARGMFVTAFIGVLDLTSGKVEYINAGHCPPLCKTQKGYQYVDVIKNLVLGITPDYKYEVGQFTLKKNERLFLYTDGVTEAQTKEEKLFGPERLQKTLNQKVLSLPDTIAHVRKISLVL
ncbi:MAG: SpoIIE family protein phosphatase [Alphaproteobacteria bacterium]|nr:SpoIIE family protein phosphatase [Alphaproteobacteria bacterium]